MVGTIIEQMEAWLHEPEILEADEGATYAEVLEIDLASITEPLLAAPNDPDKIVTLSEVAGTKIDEVFVGSCMVDITDFRAVARILEGKRVQHRMKVWTVPPDRESNVALAREGVHAHAARGRRQRARAGLLAVHGQPGPGGHRTPRCCPPAPATSTTAWASAPRSTSARPSWPRSPP